MTLYISPRLTPVPLTLRLALSAPMTTTAMTYMVMPFLTRVTHRWLYPSPTS